MPEPGGRGRQLQRVPLVVPPGAQVDRVSIATRLMKAHHRREEREAGVERRREQFDVAEVGHVAKARKGIEAAVSIMCRPCLLTRVR